MKLILHKHKKHIFLFCIVTLMYWFSMYTSVPILTAYLEYLGASHKMTGLIVGIYGFTQLLLRIPVGIASDRLQKKNIFIIFGLMFSILSGIGIVVTQEVTWILILRAFAGVAAAMWVDFVILFSSYYKKEETTKAMGTISFYNVTGQMMGILIGGWTAEVYGWESSFIIGAIAGIIGLLGAIFIKDRPGHNEKKINIYDVIEVAHDKLLLVVSLLAILSQIIVYATIFGFTPVYAQSLGATKFELGLLTFTSIFPAAIASWIGGNFLSSKYEKKI